MSTTSETAPPCQGLRRRSAPRASPSTSSARPSAAPYAATSPRSGPVTPVRSPRSWASSSWSSSSARSATASCRRTTSATSPVRAPTSPSSAWAWCSSCCSARSTCPRGRPAACVPRSPRGPSSRATCTARYRPSCTGRLLVFMLAAIALAVWLKAWSGAVVVAIGVVLVLTGFVDNNVTLAMMGGRRPGRGGRRRHRFPGRQGRDPELHRDAGALPGLAGRAALRPELAADRHHQLRPLVQPRQRATSRRPGAGCSPSSSWPAISPSRCGSRSRPSGPASPTTRSAWSCCAAARSRPSAS